MKKIVKFINYPGPREIEADGVDIIERKVEIYSNDTFENVKIKILEAFGKTEADTRGKIFLQQQIEIRDLDSMQYKHKKLFTLGAFDLAEPIEVHFVRVPILFLLYTSSKKTKRRVLHIDPNTKMSEIKNLVIKKFGILDGIKIILVHQGYELPDDKCLLDFKKFDPAHSIKVVALIVKDEEIPPSLE
ncbi:MAG: hypothetical protein ACTSWN_05150 [Promethearchaeota archaeon]